MKALPDYIEFKEFPRIPFDEIFTAGTDDLIALLEALLDLNPCRRCNATQVGSDCIARSITRLESL